MPLPDFLISANILICERVLHEEDGINSAIRIVDVFYVLQTPPDLTKAQPVVQASALVVLKSIPGYAGQHLVVLKMTKGAEFEEVGRSGPHSFASRLGADVPGGMTINVTMQFGVGGIDKITTRYLCAFLDDQEVARTPLTIWPKPPSTAAD